MQNEQAEILALQAVTYISAHENALNALLAQSGAGIDDLREQLTNPSFLAGILDFLLSDEPLLLAFCEDQNIAPTSIVRARRALPGSENLWDN